MRRRTPVLNALITHYGNLHGKSAGVLEVLNGFMTNAFKFATKDGRETDTAARSGELKKYV